MAEMMDLTGGGPTGELNPASGPGQLDSGQGQINGMLQGIMPMLVQYLSAAGQDIGAGKPIGANVNAATQKNLAAQSQAKILQKILAGGGKITQDQTGFTIKGGNHLLSEEGGVFNDDRLKPIGLSGTGASTKSGSTPGETSNVQPSGTSLMAQNLSGNTVVNPPTSPLGDINANDLVGLTPENISAALALKQRQDMISQESINSQFDNMYKLARANNAMSDTVFPVQVPGIGAVTHDQWKALPTDIRSYAAYVHQSKQANPDEPVMSLEEFKRIPGDTQLRYLEELMRDPAKMAAAKELRRAGATNVNVGEKVEVAEALEGVKNRGYFTDPKGGLVDDINKHMNSKEVQNQLVQHSPDSREYTIASTRIKEEFIKNRIKSAGGEVQSAKLEGRDFVWTVKWPGGKTSEVRYGN